MTAPGTLMMAKIFVPETEAPETMGTVKLKVEKTDVNVIDAAGRGTGEGLHLALNVAAMLISFLALVALFNALLGLVGDGIANVTGLEAGARLSLGMILGWVFAPLAWALGVPWTRCADASAACSARAWCSTNSWPMRSSTAQGHARSRSFTIATFALCGFANFSSIGIQIGGIGALAPTRRHDLARLGFRAMMAGRSRTSSPRRSRGSCCEVMCHRLLRSRRRSGGVSGRAAAAAGDCRRARFRPR